MQPNNNAAWESLMKAIFAFRDALGVASDSPIPSKEWNNYGRALELMERIRMAIKPK